MEISITRLKPGIAFSSPIQSQDGRKLLDARTVITSEFLQSLKDNNITKVVITGYPIIIGTPNTNIYNIRLKLENFINSKVKPIHNIEDKLAIIDTKISILSAVEDLVNKYTEIAIYTASSLDNVKKFREILVIITEEIINLMSKHYHTMIDIVSFYDNGNVIINHSIRTAVISYYISKMLGMPTPSIVNSVTASLLHDIGKIIYAIILEKDLGIPLEKLNMKLMHPMIGYKFSRQYLRVNSVVASAILNHHEQPDGTGFPRRIPLTNPVDKVVFMSNLFANLIEKNNYKGYAEALDLLVELGKTYPQKLDLNILKVLLKLRNNPSFNRLHKKK